MSCKYIWNLGLSHLLHFPLALFGHWQLRQLSLCKTLSLCSHVTIPWDEEEGVTNSFIHITQKYQGFLFAPGFHIQWWKCREGEYVLVVVKVKQLLLFSWAMHKFTLRLVLESCLSCARDILLNVNCKTRFTIRHSRHAPLGTTLSCKC